jgi:hypothetical protein
VSHQALLQFGQIRGFGILVLVHAIHELGIEPSFGVVS